MNRRSYRGLLRQPAWGLYRDGLLVASCRAATAEDARAVFRELGQPGDRVRRVEVTLSGGLRPRDQENT